MEWECWINLPAGNLSVGWLERLRQVEKASYLSYTAQAQLLLYRNAEVGLGPLMETSNEENAL